ncbi:uncharacterized protein TOT_040000093 [Theileria orientalis strain Shintoku]|uniref:Uncharacterized protein n=1 Tax=Theileria orientalis strain Shintoku TaxID=869250 RepID=J4CDT7_THEOR|nr:uncharacterized protein TOT_040000093 [Theileria orientalis strain Shintoku]PVC53607.1 hypothetical protein MACL_00003627 [Theileria orientalis]BAM41712.1 uncharacterized protein TOT_040000093 [Theileria orientalis strain Shintoku]|eukprot:XP_009692013.1 uncharacterized protein TOT_040000093 [Theileria orientalis strain Shintoku]
MVGKSRVQYFTNYTHTPDVLDRFKHVESSFNNKAGSDDYDLYFETTKAQKRTSDSKDAEHSLDDYSLENVESALMQFVPEYIANSKEDTSDTFMTPGQCFFLENKDKLMETVKKRYHEEKNALKNKVDGGSEGEDVYSLLLNYDFNEESYGSYGSEYTQTRKKEHLWDYNSNTLSITRYRTDSVIKIFREPVELIKGVMPTIQQIVEILEQERLVDVSVMDMDKCERRDQGLYVIIATGATPEHCRLVSTVDNGESRRVGRMLYNVIIDLEIPFVSKISYCCRSRNDEWIVSHLGPLSVHLMTEEVRKRYSLEEFWSEHYSTRSGASLQNLIE